MLVAYLTSGFLKAFGGTAASLRSATFLTTTSTEGSPLSRMRGLHGRSRWRAAPVVALRYAFSPYAQYDLLLPLDWRRVIGRRRLETRCEHLVRFVGVPLGEQTIRLLTWSP